MADVVSVYFTECPDGPGYRRCDAELSDGTRLEWGRDIAAYTEGGLTDINDLFGAASVRKFLTLRDGTEIEVECPITVVRQ